MQLLGSMGFGDVWAKPASCLCRLQMPQPRTSYSTSLGLSFLTCNMGSQKLLHSILGAELSRVGRAPRAQGAQRGEAAVLVLTALLGMQASWWPDHRPYCHSQASSAWGTQAWPQVLEGQSAGERSGRPARSVHRGLRTWLCFHVPGDCGWGERHQGPRLLGLDSESPIHLFQNDSHWWWGQKGLVTDIGGRVAA